MSRNHGHYTDKLLTTEGKSKSSSGVVRLSHDPGCYKHKILTAQDTLPATEIVTELFMCRLTLRHCRVQLLATEDTSPV